MAHYCPKCGAAAPATPDRPEFARDALPATGPIPRAGRIFLAVALLGVGLLVTGFLTRNPPLIYAGAATVGVLALAVMAGDLLA